MLGILRIRLGNGQRADDHSTVADLVPIVFAFMPPASLIIYDETRLKKGAMNTKVIIDATRPVEMPFPVPVTPPEDLWNSMKLEDYVK